MTRSEIEHLARTGGLPMTWPHVGGADADMVGVLWRDAAGVWLVGVPRPWVNKYGQVDPCSWVEVPPGVVKD